MENSLKRFILGTANIGRSTDYWRKRVPDDEAIKIIKNAKCLWGIDTAAAYENAESLIGQYADHQLQITTKGKEEGLEDSLFRLNRTHVYGYYAHRMDRLWEQWYKFLESKRRRLTRKVGFSIYEPDEIAPNLVDIVQLPWNLAEYRHNSITIDYLKYCGIEVHIRSVFGRGTLIKQFGAKKCLQAAFNTLADKIVIGVESLDQLKENIDIVDNLCVERHDENLLETRKWK